MLSPQITAAPFPAKNFENIPTAAQKYLSTLSGIPRNSKIEISPIDPSLQLNLCEQLEFHTTSKHITGNIRLRADCKAPEKWSIFVNASILVPIKYWTLKHASDSRQTLTADDLIEVNELKPHTPLGLCDDINKIIGLRLNHALRAGSPIRYTDLSSEAALSRGQTVKIISKGKGFEIQREGKLMNNAFDGQMTQVQVESRRVISGIAQKGGVVEVK